MERELTCCGVDSETSGLAGRHGERVGVGRGAGDGREGGHGAASSRGSSSRRRARGQQAERQAGMRPERTPEGAARRGEQSSGGGVCGRRCRAVRRVACLSLAPVSCNITRQLIT